MINSSDILLAYLAHKTTIPLRLGATGVLTPIIKKMIFWINIEIKNKNEIKYVCWYVMFTIKY